MNWEKVKFGDLFLESTRNGVYKSSDAHGSGCKIVNMGEIFAYDFIGKQEMQRISMTVEELEKSGLKENDLLFARRSLVESGAGKVSIVTALNEPLTFESSIIRVRLNEKICFPLFYLYWMRSHAGRTAISALITGTNVKGIRGSVLKDIDVDYPKYSTQKKIADILSAYDDLIENNKKQISLLEEAAQRLYKEWFVDMRFLGHETTKIIDGVPEGWNSGILSDVVMDVGERTKKEQRYNYSCYLPIDCLPKKSLTYIETDSLENAESSLVSFKKYDILFGAMRPYFHKVSVARENGLTRATCLVLNSQSPEYWAYAVLLMFSEKTVTYATNISDVGTTIPYVKWDGFSKMDILIPSKNVAVLFNSEIKPIIEKLFCLARQIKILTEARDRLLPKLMSGEIEIKVEQ